MYCTPKEMAIVNEAEKLMVATMAKNDPSHDKYHGKSRTFLVKKNNGGWSLWKNSATRQKDSIVIGASDIPHPRFTCRWTGYVSIVLDSSILLVTLA